MTQRKIGDPLRLALLDVLRADLRLVTKMLGLGQCASLHVRTPEADEEAVQRLCKILWEMRNLPFDLNRLNVV